MTSDKLLSVATRLAAVIPAVDGETAATLRGCYNELVDAARQTRRLELATLAVPMGRPNRTEVVQ
ncbi:hypothetical protein JCM15519_03580 [Fundidesulfovibrio butyratiphilus]